MLVFKDEFLKSKRDIALKKGGKVWRRYKAARSLLKHCDLELYFAVKDNRPFYDLFVKLERALTILKEI